MADFWEHDQVAQPAAASSAGNFWANDAVTSHAPLEPVPPSEPFAARVGQGALMGKAFEEMAAKPYSQRIKEWAAAGIKEGGAEGAGKAALGTLAATIAGIPEMVASGITLGKDVFTGKVVTGPGLRKEDLSDDPNAPDPLEALITRSMDMAMSGGVRTTFGEKPPLIDAGNGQFARPYTAQDGTMRAQVVGPPPSPVDFRNAATALGSPPETIKSAAIRLKDGSIYTGTTHADAINAASKSLGHDVLDDLTSVDEKTIAGDFLTSSGRIVGRFEAGRIADAAKQATADKDLGLISENLRRLWQEEGIHPAEAVHDAQTDAFLKHDLTTPHEPVKLDPADEKTFTEFTGKPASLGAAATGEPPLIPLSEQPAAPAGRLSASLKETGDKLLDIGRDIQMKVAPMATGTPDSRATAKDFGNTMRRNRWDWTRIDDDIATRFTPEQRERMWNAADEESVARQLGESTEHQGITTLEPEERAAVEDLQTRAQNAWVRARDLGMVEGEGLPAYTPRMVINTASATGRDAALPLNSIGGNLKTRTAQMMRRSYMTAEETEAAAQKLLGPDAKIARDIRALPLATAKLEDAIAGRTLIENIKDYGKRTGAETVAEGAIPVASEDKWFTLDHPAFRTWRPKFDAGNVVKDAEGNIVFEQVPLYVHGDFEGPLRAVLTERSGPLYQAAMSLKAKTMSLVMNSPLIHNAVEFGRAFPAMPTRIVKAYFDGNRAKNDVAVMHEAIDAGLVPIGKRFFNQDITSIMEAPDLTPGRSWTAKVLAAVPGLFDEGAGTAVKRAVDKAGDFWHNTLLWDRIGDLQMGIYVNLRGDIIAKGTDPLTASRIAAHFANRYAGSLPKEAMSDAARKFSNLTMFSRTFTLGNVGAMKDALTGLPKDVLAQIERDAGFDAGIDAVKAAKSIARRKAFATVMLDVGLLYVGNSVMQSALNMMLGDRTLSEEMHGYAKRAKDVMNRVETHPLSLLQPFDLAERLSSTSENEPGKQDRLKIGLAKDGTAIYARSPFGKIGEEFTGYLTSPLDMIRKKQSTIARPMLQVLSNDKGFGRKIYDPNAETPLKYAQNMWQIIEHIAKAQTPEGQINAFGDLVKGDGDPKVNALQAFGPVAGVTFSKGAPGGPAVGEIYHARTEHQYQVDQELPDIRKQILRGDMAGATQRMTELGVPPGLQRFYMRTTINPATRMSPRALRDFYTYSTPEQQRRFENQRSTGPMAPAQ